MHIFDCFWTLRLLQLIQLEIMLNKPDPLTLEKRIRQGKGRHPTQIRLTYLRKMISYIEADRSFQLVTNELFGKYAGSDRVYQLLVGYHFIVILRSIRNLQSSCLVEERDDICCIVGVQSDSW